jgi:protein SCO1/2
MRTIAITLLSLTVALMHAASAAPATPTTAASASPKATPLKAGVFDPPRIAPDFSLQGTDGRELKMSGHRGKIVLLAFGYSSCPAVCPTTLATFAETRRRLGQAAQDVQVIYITVDPERDDSAHLKKYLDTFDSTFIGGTGAPNQLAAVRKAYGISAEKIPAGDTYSYSHSSFTYLIDRAGRIRALMPYGHNPKDYVHDLTILLGE